jgi:hypothetical protein
MTLGAVSSESGRLTRKEQYSVEEFLEECTVLENDVR